MEILQTVVEISKMNLVGTLEAPLITAEKQRIFLTRLKKKFNYRLAITFSIGLENPGSGFRLDLEVDVIHDVIFSTSALSSDNLYALYSQASLAAKEKINEKLVQSGFAAIFDWDTSPKGLIEKQLDEAIVNMIYKETSKKNELINYAALWTAGANLYNKGRLPTASVFLYCMLPFQDFFFMNFAMAFPASA